MKKIHNVLVAAALTAVILMTSCQPARQPAAVPSETAENHTESAETSAYGDTTCVPDSSLIADTQDSRLTTETETETAAVTETETDEETTETDLVSQKNIEPDSTDPINTAPPDTEPKVTESEETQTPPADLCPADPPGYQHRWTLDPEQDDYTPQNHWIVCRYCSEKRAQEHYFPETLVKTGAADNGGDLMIRKCFNCHYVEETVFERDPSDVTSPGLVLRLMKDGTYEVSADTSYDVTKIKELNIPSVFRGVPVTIISDWGFQGCTGLETVTVPEGIEWLGGSAFYDCSALKTVILPESIVEIGQHTFENCSSLTGINIPSEVKYIQDKCFDGCVSLKSCVIPDGVEFLGYGIFRGCSALEHVDYPSDKNYIPRNMFEGCASLSDFSIPDHITSINSYAFSGCSGLKTIDLHSGITVKNGAFERCTGLTEVTIPEDWTVLPPDIFCGCSSLKKINVKPGQIKELGSDALAGTAITDISAFYLTEKVGSMAFGSCPGLTEIFVPGQWNCDVFCSYLFCGCNNLRSITFADDCKELGYYWFSECNGLTEVVLPETIEKIWDFCFSDCTNLKTVTIKNKNLSIKSRNTFGNDPIDTINYAGTVAEWNERNLSSYFDSEHYTVHCTDGDIVK